MHTICLSYENLNLEMNYRDVATVLNATLIERPWLSEELYCQLTKQTLQTNTTNQNNCEPTWLLWKLLSIFIPTTDTLRPYLVKYIAFRNDIQQSKLKVS
ncbi:unnamed protein product [Heterobilharzia americana]|nr:unnamed protein product [Heterobilharzia americana]